MPDQTIVITGAAGRIGGYLRSRMHRPGRVLRLVDIADVGDTLAAGEESFVGDIGDRALLRAACAGADAVVHLGGLACEASWSEILRVNVDGSQSVFEAAVAGGVPRVVFASSNHAVGCWERPTDGSTLADDVEPRPDTFYGWSKATVEMLGRLFHERHGLTVVNLRIGTCAAQPDGRHSLTSWLSPDDVGRLVDASLDPSVTGFHTVWGVSANTRSWWSAEGGQRIGFRPQDDAELYATALEANGRLPLPDRVGGGFVDYPLGGPMPA